MGYQLLHQHHQCDHYERTYGGGYDGSDNCQEVFIYDLPGFTECYNQHECGRDYCGNSCSVDAVSEG